MSRNGSFYQDDSECVVYVKFPVQNSELDEQVVKHLFSQFGGFSKITMRPDNNYAFVTYEKPAYALYVCKLLNNIEFMGSRLMVKPRDKSRNSEIFQSSKWSRPTRQYYAPFYTQLERIPFEDVDARDYFDRDEA